MNKCGVKKKAWWLGTMGLVLMLAMAAGHCFADGEEVNNGDSCPSDQGGCPTSITTSISVQSGARYRKIGLNGMPMPDEKPQHKDESDQHPEETYIDALDLSLNHSVTDIYIPLGGSADLALNIRRNVQSEVWNIKSGLKPPGGMQTEKMIQVIVELLAAHKTDHNLDPALDDVNPNKPFGYCWNSNLTPTIQFANPWQEHDPDSTCEAPRMEPDTATVVDENGKAHRFVTLYHDGALGFMPLPESDSQQDTMADTLAVSGTDGSGKLEYTFRRKYGTKIVFKMTANEKNAVGQPMSADPNANGGTRYTWARAISVEDRYGTTISYAYPEGDLLTLIPSSISSRGKTITIGSSGGLVRTITDPRGKVWTFSYNNQGVPAGDAMHYQVFSLPMLTKVKGPDDKVTSYGYFARNQIDFQRPVAPSNDFKNWWCYAAVNKITDQNNHAYQILYQIPYTRRQVYEYNSLGKGYYFDFSVQPCVYQVKLPSLGGAAPESAYFDDKTGIFLWNYDPHDGKKIAVLGSIGSKTTDAEGNYHEYDFGKPVATPANEFEDLLYHSADKRNVPILLTCNSMKLLQPDYTHYETFVYDGDVGSNITLPGDGGHFQHSTFGGHTGELASTTDLCGNTTTFEYGDTWDAHGSVSYLGAYPLIHFPNPTKQTDALGHSKTFTYDSTWRIMRSCTDEQGHTTLNDIDPDNGNRLSEKIYDAPGTISTISGTSSRGLIFHSGSLTPTGNLVQETDYEYANTSFPGFLTKKTVKKLSLAGDPSGSWFTDLVTQYVPDAAGNVAQVIVDPGSGHLNLTTTGSYDANNNKISSTDPRGNVTYFSYDSKNRLTTTTYPDGTSKSFVYDARGNKVAEYDENGYATLYAYDEWNRVITQARDMNANSVINSGTDLVTHYTYNNVDSKTSVTDANGNTTQMVYDSYQRLIKTINPDWSGSPLTVAARTTTYTYDITKNCGGDIFNTSKFKVSTMTDPNGAVIEFDYDKLYRKTHLKATYQPASGASPAKTADRFMEYDDVGNVIASIDPLGNRTETDYDALNRPTVIRFGVTTSGSVNSAYGYTQNFYTSTDLKWQAQDELGVLVETDYDAAGRAVKTIEDSGPLGLHSTVQTSYDACGNVIAAVDPMGNQHDFVFDNRNRKIQEQEPAVVDVVSSGTLRPTKTYKYDNAGHIITTVDARGNVYKSVHTSDTAYQTDAIYDTANRLIQITQPPDASGHRPVATTQYDLNGNIIRVTDPNGHSTTNSYDALNRLVSTTDSLGIAVNYTYDQVGNRLTVSDGLGQTTIFAYDGLKRNTSETDAGGNVTAFEYDGLNMTKRTDALSQATNYTYDKRNRLATLEYPGRTADNRTYSYDKTGGLLSVAVAGYSHAADVSYTYDTLRRAITETSGGLTHIYTYDLAGNRLGVIYGGTGRTVVSTYDALNRLATMTEGGSRITTYSYDLNGNIGRKTLPNGDVTVTTYDDLNRALQIQDKTSGGLLLEQYVNTYDFVGNVTAVAETYATGSAVPARNLAMGYDDGNRLLTEAATIGTNTVTTAYTYDNANNRLTKAVSGGATTSYTYNSLNQVTSYSDGATSVSLTYDANGNRATRVVGSGVDTYSYDVENRLVGLVKGIGGTGITTGTYAYLYDYRIRRIKRDESAASGVSTQVIFSGGSSAEELDGGNTTPAVEYVRGSDLGGGVGGVLYTLRGTAPGYTHYNSRGDVVAKTDGTGSLTYQASYEAFGTRTAQSGATLDRQKANTKDEDPTGLLDEGCRYRDLETGSFITKDPLGFAAGPNVYTYVLQNPWSKFDPEGLDDSSTNNGSGDNKKQVDPGMLGGLLDKINPLIPKIAGLLGEISVPLEDAAKNVVGKAQNTVEQLKNAETRGKTEAELGFGATRGAFEFGMDNIHGVQQMSAPELSFVTDMEMGFISKYANKAFDAWSQAANLDPNSDAVQTSSLGTKTVATIATFFVGGEEGAEQLLATGERAVKGRTIQLLDSLGERVAGVFDGQATFISRSGVREFAAETGNSIRTELYRTAYHEAFHRGIDPIYRAACNITGRELYSTSRVWHATEEGLAEGYGRARAFLRQRIGWK